MMRSLKLQGRPWSFSDIPCSHGQKKGKDWMERCTASTCFLTHISYTRHVEATFAEKPKSRDEFSQPTAAKAEWQLGVTESSFLSCVAACSGNWNVLPIERLGARCISNIPC